MNIPRRITTIIIGLVSLISSAHGWDQETNVLEDGYLKAVALAPADGEKPWRIVALDSNGIVVLDPDGQQASTIPDRIIERVQTLSTSKGTLLVAPEEQAGIHLWLVNQQTGALTPWMGDDSLWAVDFAPVMACLSHDARQDQVFVFAATELGEIYQYRVVHHAAGQSLRLIRTLNIGGEVTSCAPGGNNDWLYVSEPGVGVWRVGLHEEAEPIREPVAFVAPFGRLDEAVHVAVNDDGVLVVLGEETVYFLNPDSGAILSSHQVPSDFRGAEGLAVSRSWLVLGVEGDERTGGGSLFSTTPPALSARFIESSPRVAQVQPVAQTHPVGSAGDAADDPAIWIHSDDPEKSRILGTDKQAGLYVYNLAGEVVQFLPAGKVNNVDIRYGFTLGDGSVVDLAVATNRSSGSLTIWSIDRSSGELIEIGAGMEALVMNEPYGLCLYHDTSNQAFYAIANSKAGQVEQYRLQAKDQKLATTKLVRSFEVGSITEGCVVDDAHHRLFIGEETRGIWVYDASPESAASFDDRTLVDAVAPEGRLTADIEGLALYLTDETNGHLIASVQGANQYAVYDRQPPYRFVGFFEIVASPERGIDGVSETDGLEVVNYDFGSSFESGLVVVQDGRNVEPPEHQNFKLVPWRSIQQALGL